MNETSSIARMTVPFLDLKRQHAQLGKELLRSILDVLEDTAFCLGPAVARFEQAFASFVEVEHCIGVNSGTSALHLALRAAGVRPGTEVITVAHTWISTAWAVSYCGAKPVFVDVVAGTGTLDSRRLAGALTPQTAAVMPVHLYGHPADMEPILEFAKVRGLPVIEDAAQAHGARYRGKACGSMGIAGCFSFYPSKNLGACGEGGAVVTADAALAKEVAVLRNHAQVETNVHQSIGFNYRMEGLQAATLGVKLPFVAAWNERRRQIAARYLDELAPLSGRLTLPHPAPWAEPAWHIFAVHHERRDRLMQELARRGVQTRIHYPTPVHLQPAYSALGYGPGSLPVTERLAATELSLPLFPEMTDDEVTAVIENLRGALAVV